MVTAEANFEAVAEFPVQAADDVAVAALPVVSCVPDVFTPGKLILAEPSNDTPPMVTAEANFEAVAEFPVHVTADVAVDALPVVSCVPDVFTPGKLILADPSNDTPPMVTAEANFEAVAEFPVHVTADVAVAALPVVSCVPDVFTPGKLILAEPSNDTPPMVTADSNLLAVAEFPVHVTADVAVAALPVVSCVPDVFTPGKLILAEPSNDTPPMVTADANLLAVVALPSKVLTTRVDGIEFNSPVLSYLMMLIP